MAIRRRSRVVDLDGVSGWMHGIVLVKGTEPVARVRLSNGGELMIPFEVLHHDDRGGYRLSGRWRDFTQRSTSGTTTIPVIQERATVSVRPAPERKTRIRRRIVSQPQVVETPIWQERVEIQRVPIGQIVERAPAARQDGDVLIVPVVEEITVVEKRLRVREELRIRVVREQRIHRETVQVRRHEIEIESAEQAPPSKPITRKGD